MLPDPRPYFAELMALRRTTQNKLQALPFTQGGANYARALKDKHPDLSAAWPCNRAMLC